jgi:hypothetical protein
MRARIAIACADFGRGASVVRLSLSTPVTFSGLADVPRPQLSVGRLSISFNKFLTQDTERVAILITLLPA